LESAKDKIKSIDDADFINSIKIIRGIYERIEQDKYISTYHDIFYQLFNHVKEYPSYFILNEPKYNDTLELLGRMSGLLDSKYNNHISNDVGALYRHIPQELYEKIYHYLYE
jgi:hypothetical protein